ncbi:MAG: hydroxyacid dehydrogenase [Bacteroidales bacterium]|nr:hydroxyacid dehydrogenase [Candidatus Colimorpha onthohippi]
MNITCVEPLGMTADYLERQSKRFAEAGHKLTYFMDRIEDEDALIHRMQEADIVVISNIRLSATVLSKCPNLKYLSVAFTGLDHIDLAYCQQHHIEVQNASGYSTVAVSELAIGLMLDLMRQTTRLDAAIRKGGSRGGYLGAELHGKTIGVVGTGAIGTATIRLLKAFGCDIIAYNRTEHPEVKAMGVDYLPIDEVMRRSDIVTLHVPLTAETRHLIGRQQLELMKPTALLINTARGDVVDIQALSEALHNHTIAGAAIDVYDQEPPLPPTHALLQAPNCLCVPHIGYATREAFDIRADLVFNHVAQYLKM